MITTLQQVKLNGQTLWLVAEPGERDGALSEDPSDFENGRPSFAHLFRDGTIKRFREQIGTWNDLVFTGVCHQANPDVLHALENMLTDPGWLGPS